MDIAQPRSGRVDALQSTAREAVYRTIPSRRDVRGEFLPDPVSLARLSRLKRDQDAIEDRTFLSSHLG